MGDEEEVLLLSLLYCQYKKKKQRQRIWVHPIIQEREEKGHFRNLFSDLKKHEDKFFNFSRMSRYSFQELLDAIKENVTKKDTVMRKCISPEEKLAITLRYLASGCSLTDLQHNFRVGRTTAGVIVREVCDAIWTCLRESTIPPFSTDRWHEIARGFETYARFPNCIGAVDGKHIRMKQPPNSGSMFYNFKNYFSTVLFAMCDANYCFTYIEVGSYGKSSNSGIFKNSLLYKMMCDGTLNLPTPRNLDESSNELFPYVIVGDDAFPLSDNLLKPYGGKFLTPTKQNFNNRLSTARRYIESTFGILANKWRIFHRPMDVDIDIAESIIKAACILHNFVRIRDGLQLSNDIQDECPFQQLSTDSTHRGNIRALSTRDKFANFFYEDNNR